MRQLFLILILLWTPVWASAATVKYEIDAGNSDLGFVYFFGDDPVRGRFPAFDADINIDFDSVSRSDLSVTLDATDC